MENIFLKLFAWLQSRDINGMSPNPFTWRWQVFFLAKEKRTWNLLFAYVNVHISYKMMHRTGLETNSSWDVSRGKEKVPMLQWICWVQKSGLIFFFHVCYHAGGSTKHLGRPKVRRSDEESSPSDLTPEKRKTCLAGKTRTYLWVCPLTPTPRPHFSSPLPLQNKNS